MIILRALGAVALLATGSVCADPVVLSDVQMDGVTAGYYDTSPSTRDSIVVGDAAAARVHDISTVTLDGNAQDRARAVNLVNGAQSAVANGSNVWDGNRAATGAATALNQSNAIRQQGSSAGHVTDWQLQGVNVVTQKTETVDSQYSGGIIPAVFTITGTVTQDTASTDADGNPTTTRTTSHPVETLNIGEGVAMAGEADLRVGGGAVTVFDHEKTTQTGSTTVSFFWGLVSDTTTTQVTTESSFGDNTNPVVVLQPFSAHVKGVACIVAVGSCAPDTGFYSSSSQTRETRVYPARVQGAGAAHVVLSGGALEEQVGSSVTLRDQTQRDLSALHAVNAAGSQVANAANVSRGIATTAMPRAMELQQVNQVTQRR